MKHLKPSAFVICLSALVALALSTSVEGASGEIYETDFSSGNVFKFTPAGARTTFTSGLSEPEGMAFDRSGNFFVTEAGSGRIVKFSPSGAKTTFASGLNGPASLAFDAAGNLFDAEFFGNTIVKFSPAGARTVFASGLSGPSSLAFNSAGNLFVTDFHSGNIFRYTSTGGRTTFATGLNQPHGLAFDRGGNLFEADFGSGRIYKFTPAGARTVFATVSAVLTGSSLMVPVTFSRRTGTAGLSSSSPQAELGAHSLLDYVIRVMSQSNPRLAAFSAQLILIVTVLRTTCCLIRGQGSQQFGICETALSRVQRRGLLCLLVGRLLARAISIRMDHQITFCLSRLRAKPLCISLTTPSMFVTHLDQRFPQAGI